MPLTNERDPRPDPRDRRTVDRRDYNEAVTGDHPGPHPASRQAEQTVGRRTAENPAR